MTPSAVPAMIAWPFIAFMTVVLLGRYRWFNENLSEKYINNTLAFLWAAQLLREPFVQRQMIDSALVTEPGVWQISTALMGYSFGRGVEVAVLDGTRSDLRQVLAVPSRGFPRPGGRGSLSRSGRAIERNCPINAPPAPRTRVRRSADDDRCSLANFDDVVPVSA